MRELAWVGVVGILSGLGSYYATSGQFGWFSRANLALGLAALLAAGALGARRVRLAGGPASRPVVLRGLLRIAAALAVAVALERAAARSDLRFDWTLEQRFELAPATVAALTELCGQPDAPLVASLFADPYDPRARRTRLLLETLAAAAEGCVEVRSLDRDDAPEEEDRFGIGTSNTVVLELGRRFETVERPTEGALYEALYRMRSLEAGVVTLLRGEGEGDVLRHDELGYSGLGAALATEGYELRSVVSAAMDAVPPETDVLLAIAPERRLPGEALAALETWLAGGGRLVAFVEPGVESGLGELLAAYGLRPAAGVVVDPAAGNVEGRPRGVCPVAFTYETHPVTRGLDRNRMTFFCGARTFELSKPAIEDDVRRLVLASPRSWISGDLSLLTRRAGAPASDGALQDYHPLVVSGRYARDGREVRIVAFGDADFANNRNLRTLYNLDLVLNAVHWTAERESEITFRPKIRTTVQFPLPLENTLRTLYGVGLLVPELLLVAGGIVWLRRRRG